MDFILNRIHALPHVGRRMVKSAVGVGLCFIVYLLRGQQGIVFYSMIALLQCMQQDMSGTLKMAGQRTIGTLVGAAFGILVFLLRYLWLPGVFSNELIYYLLVTIMVIPVLYVTVVMKWKSSSYFSVVVFLCITVSHIEDADPMLFVFNRVLDTFIGIAISIPVNMFRIPRRKREDILFVCDADTALLNKEDKLTPYTRFELKSMLQEGAQVTISTMRTPAAIMEMLGDINWPLPVIAMDGAVLFDLRSRQYVEKVSLPADRVRLIRTFFRERGMNCFANTLIDGVLLICYTELKDEAEKHLIHDLSRSAYRNFVRTDLTEEGKVLYIMAVDETERIRQAAEDMKTLPCCGELKICVYESEDYPGNSYIKIFDRNATREHMTARLKERTGLECTVIIATEESPRVRFGVMEEPADSAGASGQEKGLSHPNILVKPYDGEHAVKALEKEFEPYFWEK